MPSDSFGVEVEKGVVRRPMLGETRAPKLVCFTTDLMGLSSTALAVISEVALEGDKSTLAPLAAAPVAAG